MKILSRFSMLYLLLEGCLSSVSGADLPKAVFSETRISFGIARQGTLIEHEIMMKNEGAAALRILGIRTTAPFLIDRMPAQTAPGAETSLHVLLDTSKLSGHFEGEILISLNDPAMPEASLMFDGRIVPPIELSPRPIFIVAGQRGANRQAAIDIINHEAEPLLLESIKHPEGRFSTELRTIDAGQRYRIILTLNPDGPGGKKTETILVRTSSPTMPVLSIVAHTYLRERVYTFPDAVDLGTLRLPDIKANPHLLQQTAQTLMVYQSGGEDFRIKLHTDLPFLELKTVRGPMGDRYQNTVNLIGERLQAGLIDGSITIETNDSAFPVLTIPVRGEIR